MPLTRDNFGESFHGEAQCLIETLVLSEGTSNHQL